MNCVADIIVKISEGEYIHILTYCEKKTDMYIDTKDHTHL